MITAIRSKSVLCLFAKANRKSIRLSRNAVINCAISAGRPDKRIFPDYCYRDREKQKLKGSASFFSSGNLNFFEFFFAGRAGAGKFWVLESFVGSESHLRRLSIGFDGDFLGFLWMGWLGVFCAAHGKGRFFGRGNYRWDCLGSLFSWMAASRKRKRGLVRSPKHRIGINSLAFGRSEAMFFSSLWL